MGRRYSGNINGNFWFGVQSSRDGEFFGAMESEPKEINYYISAGDKDEVLEKIKECEKELGEWLQLLNNYFKKYDTYSQNKIIDYSIENNYKLKIFDFDKKISCYARLKLGLKIKKFFEKNPECDCYFEAEI
jgi:hypothetical protein